MLGLDYFTSSALFKCACDTQTVDIVSAVFKAEGAAAEAAKHAGDGSTSSVGGGGGSSGGGSGGDGSAAVSGDDVEVFGNGQLVYKEPMGGHLVNFHQDAAFFEFSGVGPVGKHPLDLRPCVCAPGGVPGCVYVCAVQSATLAIVCPPPITSKYTLVLCARVNSPANDAPQCTPLHTHKGTLNYTIDTDLNLSNGPLYVLPRSHASFIEHVDTSSHLGLDPTAYNVETQGMVL